MNSRVPHVKVLVIPADESEAIYTRHIPKDQLYGEMRKLVGGFIEHLNTEEPAMYSAYVNEEGRVTDPPLPPNTRFNRFLGPDAENYRPYTVITAKNDNGHWYQDITAHPDLPGGFALGTVVITGPMDPEGYDTSVKTTVVERISTFIGQSCVHSVNAAR